MQGHFIPNRANEPRASQGSPKMTWWSDCLASYAVIIKQMKIIAIQAGCSTTSQMTKLVAQPRNHGIGSQRETKRLGFRWSQSRVPLLQCAMTREKQSCDTCSGCGCQRSRSWETVREQTTWPGPTLVLLCLYQVVTESQEARKVRSVVAYSNKSNGRLK